MSRFNRICRTTELPEGAVRGFAVPASGGAGLRTLVTRRGGALYAYVNRCPHTGVGLDWIPDRFLDAEGRHLQCATHGALFRIEDGFCIFGPCAGERLEALSVRERDGWIEIAPAT